MKLYDSQTIAKAIQINYRTLMRWIEKGLIQPAIYPKRGRSPVYFSEENLREVAILSRLRAVISPSKLREALQFLRQQGYNPLSSGQFLVLDYQKGRVIKICQDPHEGALELTGRYRGQLVLLPLLGIDEAMRKAKPVQIID